MQQRRPIEFFVAQYKNNSNIRDVFVEGKTDRLLIKAFLRKIGVSDWVVRDIATVDVSDDLVLIYGHNRGAKGRCRTFAQELARMGYPDQTPVLIAVDRDTDFERQEAVTLPTFVVETDLPDIESYSFSEDNIDRLLKLHYHIDNVGPSTVIQEITPVLLDLVAVRYVLRELERPVALHYDICRSLSWLSNGPVLSILDLISRSLDRGSPGSSVD